MYVVVLLDFCLSRLGGCFMNFFFQSFICSFLFVLKCLVKRKDFLRRVIRCKSLVEGICVQMVLLEKSLLIVLIMRSWRMQWEMIWLKNLCWVVVMIIGCCWSVLVGLNFFSWGVIGVVVMVEGLVEVGEVFVFGLFFIMMGGILVLEMWLLDFVLLILRDFLLIG